MPAFANQLSDADIQAVADYVVSEFGTPGDVPRGGVLYRLNCAGCHGAAMRGGALIDNNRNAPLTDEPVQCECGGSGAFGPGQMPAFNAAALSDQQVADIAAYVQSLRSPPQPGGFSFPLPGPVPEGLVALILGLGGALLAAVWVERGGRG